MNTYKVEEYNEGTVIYRNFDDEYHRIGAPAIISKNGNVSWYLNGKCHREDGPAIEKADGTKIWYFNGELHRVDGPAIEWPDGSKFWYINGVRYTESEFNER